MKDWKTDYNPDDYKFHRLTRGAPHQIIFYNQDHEKIAVGRPMYGNTHEVS